jgi:thiol-disulfide isomerase/thioredoxin
MDYQQGPDNYPQYPQQVPTRPVRRRRNLAVFIVPVALVVLVLAGVFALLLLGRSSPNPVTVVAGGSPVATVPLKEAPSVGSIAPDFELKDVNTGETVKLSSLRGRPVWINFWATWCPPCRDEMPDMEKIYGEYKSKNLAILGVDVQESDQKVKEFTGSLELTWTFTLDAKGDISNRYFVSALPSHFFVDKDGVIRAIHTGGLTNMSGTRKVDPREYLAKIVAP